MNYHADDWFTITGRGTVAVISEHDRKTRKSRNKLRNRVVNIDNVRYTVLGVEDCLVGDEDHVCDKPLGLLVKKCKNQPPEAFPRENGELCSCTCHSASMRTLHISACCRPSTVRHDTK